MLHKNKLKVAIISGSWPPEVCGVGDYTELLAGQLEEVGVVVSRISHSSWSWECRHEIEHKIRDHAPDILHLQYPARGYGASRVPAWLMWKCRDLLCVVTLHEYSAQVGSPICGVIPRGLPHYIPFSIANALIFSSDYELSKLASIAPWITAKSHVLPIGSNIPVSQKQHKRQARLVHFGQICPNKGIENFLRLSKIINQRQLNLECLLIGNVPQGFSEWAAPLLSQMEAANVGIYQGASATAVADIFAASQFAYLPFPDGASAKRGSLLAALINGVIVITRHGSDTPNWIREVTLHADTPDQAAEILHKLGQDINFCDSVRDKALSIASQIDWKDITLQHLNIYYSLMMKHGQNKKIISTIDYEKKKK